MKVVVFAGGLGTRLSDETAKRPKLWWKSVGAPDHLAHHAMLRSLWAHGFHRTRRLPRRVHPAIFSELQNVFIFLISRSTCQTVRARLSSSRFLAKHGYASRQAGARRYLARRKRTVQSLEGLMEVDFSFLEL